MLKVDQMKKYSYDETHCGYGDTRNSVSDASFYGLDASSAILLQASCDQMLCNAGVGVRRFSGADDFTQFHSSNFAGMNTSGVVATGSWGSPSKDFATVMQEDRQAVFGFDFIDLIPSDGEFLDWVRNGYALIEDENLWLINDEINDAAEENRPIESNEAAGERATQPILNIQTTNQNQNNPSRNGAGFGSKKFGVSHMRILSHSGSSHV